MSATCSREQLVAAADEADAILRQTWPRGGRYLVDTSGRMSAEELDEHPRACTGARPPIDGWWFR